MVVFGGRPLAHNCEKLADHSAVQLYMHGIREKRVEMRLLIKLTGMGGPSGKIM